MAQPKGKQLRVPIIVYGCKRCTEIINFLEANDLTYRLIDIEHDLEATMLIADANQGRFTMPAVQIGEDFYSLPTPAQLAERLGIEEPPVGLEQID